ncbi:AAA family ATPase [Mesorhizobium sp. M1312]|uniref:AAA family ATPase n=1 Tax=unclassified Mesorhizobium TaxID=325217 RepID=UPI00333CFEA9
MTTANEIITKLGGNGRTGMCRCPAHDDQNPSLHVSNGRKGVVVRCHAGCSQENVIAALRQHGLWSKTSDRVRLRLPANTDANRTERTARKLLDAAEKSTERPKAYLQGRGIKLSPPTLKLVDRGTMSAIAGTNLPAMIAPITNKDGQSVGAHVTYLMADAKKNAVGKNGKARRMYGTVGGGLVVLGEPDPKKPFIVAEGIETVLSAMQISGFPGGAATSAGNMEKLRLPKAAGYIIAADNDPPGGKAAAALAARARLEGSPVRVAMPTSKGLDWNDVLQGDDPEACWQAALDADNGRKSSESILALEESKFMELKFPTRDLLLDPWLPLPGLAMIYAPRGEGKTWLAAAIAKAVAGGRGLLGWKCPGGARVLYVEGELSGRSVQGRLKKFRPSPPGMLHILSRDTCLLHRQTMPDLGDTEGRQEMDRIIEQCRPDLVIIDTLSTMVRSGIENDAESWAPVQAWLLDHRWHGRTIIVLHHSGKSGQQRGTSKREDVMDTIIKLKKQPEVCTETESVFDLTFEKSRDFYGEAAESMRLRFSTEGDRAKWRAEPMRDVQAEKVREMLKARMKQKDIAREMNVSPGRVSQIVKEIRERGEERAISRRSRSDMVRERNRL